MKKGLLVVAILLFVGSGVAFAFALDRFQVASERLKAAESSIKKMGEAKDMNTAESEGDWVKMDAEAAGDARRLGMMGGGGGAVLLIASIILFVKSRGPKTA